MCEAVSSSQTSPAVLLMCLQEINQSGTCISEKTMGKMSFGEGEGKGVVGIGMCLRWLGHCVWRTSLGRRHRGQYQQSFILCVGALKECQGCVAEW